MSSSFGIQDLGVQDSVNTVNYNTVNAQYLHGVSTIDPNCSLSYVVNTGGVYNITLPNGNYSGQQQTIIVTANPASASQNITLLYNNAYGDSQEFIFGQVGDSFFMISTPLGWQIVYSPESQLPVVLSSTFVPYNYSGSMLFEGNVVSQGTSPVFEKGVVYNTTSNPIYGEDSHTSAGSIGLGSYSINFNIGYYSLIYARAYAINSVGITYGTQLIATPTICLAKGTLITLADDTTKTVENIDYSDNIKVWDFDKGEFASAKPIWIKIAEKTIGYNLLTFSDGSQLKTINQHRIFNKELGKFTYPMTDDTPIGTTTFTVSGEYPTLESKYIIEEEVDYYNIMTDYHLNFFANGILVSCRYNNIYPIVDMKFVKDERTLRPVEEFKEISKVYVDGFRLSEQKFSLQDIKAYITNLENHK